MGIVRVNDVGPQLLDDARELPPGVQIDFGARRQAHEIVPFGRAGGELAFGVRNQHGSVTALAKTQHGEEYLALPASPCSRRVDMDGKQLLRVQESQV